jgi:hypothetical protein
MAVMLNKDHYVQMLSDLSMPGIRFSIRVWGKNYANCLGVNMGGVFGDVEDGYFNVERDEKILFNLKYKNILSVDWSVITNSIDITMRTPEYLIGTVSATHTIVTISHIHYW